MNQAALGATDALRAMAAGSLTAEGLARACLAQVSACEPAVGAFAAIDADAVMRSAQDADRSNLVGQLRGVPFAVKDVIDTAGLPTEMGCEAWRGNQPPSDAACVALALAAGGVLLGKTVTAEMAYVTPGRTTNPHAAGHTPGGSSSGSAAAVAAGMAPLAIGTQTGGSVLRPASFCGVVGFKPSFGVISRAGVKAMAESLDTVGVFARSVADAGLFAAVLAGMRSDAPAVPYRPPRLGLCRTFMWEFAAAEARGAVLDAAGRMRQAGAEVSEAELPIDLPELARARLVINDFEVSRSLAHEWRTMPTGLGSALRAAIERGRVIGLDEWHRAQAVARDARRAFEEAMRPFDALLVLAAQGEAPVGLGSTGDSSFQSLWTVLHGPAIGLPTHRGPRGLPVGIQLVAAQGDDAGLLRTASWVAERLGSATVMPELTSNLT